MNIQIRIDEDINKIAAKVKRAPDSDLALVVPRGAALFFDPKNLRFIKKLADGLDKKIALVTMDPDGIRAAEELGIEIKDQSVLRGRAVAMDVNPVQKTQPVWTPPKHEVSLEDLPQYKEAEKLPEADLIRHPIYKPAEPVGEPVGPVEPAIEKKTASVLTEKPNRKVNVPEKSGALLRRFGFFSIVLAILIGLALALFVLPEAKLTVFARSIPVKTAVQLNVDQSAPDYDYSSGVIPGTIISKDIIFSKHFDATGKVDVGSKAGGKVQIYNFSGKILRLNAATTTLSIGEKKYHFTQDVTNIIPTKTIPGSKNIDSSSLIAPVLVVAEESGEASQAAKGVRVEIMNQAFGSKPTLLYAITADPIEGGDSRISSTITVQDIDAAKQQLSAMIKSQAEQDIASAQKLETVDSGVRVDSEEITFDKNAGDASVNFDGQVKAHITALAYDPQNLQNFVRQKISSALPKNQYLASNQKGDLVPVFTNIDFSKGIGTISAAFTGVAGTKLDIKGIASKINGKTAEQLKEILLSDPDIEGVDVEFSPFWVKSVPRFSGRVTVIEALQK